MVTAVAAADEKRVSGGGGGTEREAVKKCKPTQIFSRKTATTDAGSAALRPMCICGASGPGLVVVVVVVAGVPGIYRGGVEVARGGG